MINECVVSVICSTFNQKEYIVRAVESILNQKTDFEYEILIHDDASNDGTYEIVQRFAENYSQIRIIIREQKNLYSQGISFLGDIIRKEARGRYIAICEGDDFWIDDHKLQLQYEALESHPECDMCACWGCTVTENGEREVSQIRPMTQDGILTIEDVILGGGQYLVTAGLFFRTEMYDDMKGLSNLDYAQQIRGALRGGIVYLDRKMAVYRRYAKGSWTNNVLKNDKELEKQWDKERSLLRLFDEHTGFVYHEVIQERLKAYTSFDVQLKEHSDEIESIFKSCEAPVYIWGMGRRGTALEAYCKEHHFSIDGICDAANSDIGNQTVYENIVFSTEEVITKAETILASNQFAYKDLLESDYNGTLIDFQQYMPLG